MIDFERAYLSICLHDLNIFIQSHKSLNVHDFTHVGYAHLYERMKHYVDTHHQYDQIEMLTHALHGSPLSPEDTENIMNTCANAANVAYYIQAIKDASNVRRVKMFADQAIESFGLKPDENQKIVGQLIDNLSELQAASAKEKVTLKPSDYFDEVIKQGRNPDVTRRGISTGFAGLDEHIGGLKPGALITIAAPPGGGKTAFALNLAVSAIHQHKKVFFYNLEVTCADIIRRVFAQVASIDSRRLDGSHKLSDSEEERLLSILGPQVALLDRYFRMTDTFDLTVAEMVRQVKLSSLDEPVDLVIVDYLQLMTASATNLSKYEQITELTRRLRIASVELNIPIVMLCQFNRDGAKAEKPSMFELRDSGSIEQDSVIVMLLYMHEEQKGKETPEVNLFIAKNRGGPNNVEVKLKYYKNVDKFREV